MYWLSVTLRDIRCEANTHTEASPLCPTDSCSNEIEEGDGVKGHAPARWSAGGDGFLYVVEVRGQPAADTQGQRWSGEMAMMLKRVCKSELTVKVNLLHFRKVCHLFKFV